MVPTRLPLQLIMKVHREPCVLKEKTRFHLKLWSHRWVHSQYISDHGNGLTEVYNSEALGFKFPCQESVRMQHNVPLWHSALLSSNGSKHQALASVSWWLTAPYQELLCLWLSWQRWEEVFLLMWLPAYAFTAFLSLEQHAKDWNCL